MKPDFSLKKFMMQYGKKNLFSLSSCNAWEGGTTLSTRFLDREGGNTFSTRCTDRETWKQIH